jgi:hypothetical protein
MPVMTTAALSGADTPCFPLSMTLRVGSTPNQPGVIALPAISQKVKLRTEFRSTILRLGSSPTAQFASHQMTNCEADWLAHRKNLAAFADPLG